MLISHIFNITLKARIVL